VSNKGVYAIKKDKKARKKFAQEIDQKIDLLFCLYFKEAGSYCKNYI